MNILHFLQQDGFNPVWQASTNGAEYACACPICGGNDRFRVWPNKDNAWCRNKECKWNPDSIEYLRKIRKLSFHEAQSLSGKVTKNSYSACYKPSNHLSKAPEPRSQAWFEKTLSLIQWAEDKLHNTSQGKKNLQWIYNEKGITADSAKEFHIGWNPSWVKRDRASWGLTEKLKEDGTKADLWIPKGFVIPSISKTGIIMNIRIRTGGKNKYSLLPGSNMQYLVTGNMSSKACFVVESDLDAILLHQEAEDLACFVSTGSTNNNPSGSDIEFLGSKSRLFLSHDSDDPGRKAAREWNIRFPHAVRWPVIKGKDPAEARKNGLDLRLWVEAALNET